MIENKKSQIAKKDTLSKINKLSILTENSINNKVYTDLRKTNYEELKDVAE